MVVYCASDVNDALRQGEILRNVPSYSVDPESGEVDYTVVEYCIIGSQDCDLARHWDDFSSNAPNEQSVLLFEAVLVDIARPRIKGSDLWKRIVQNDDSRYHFLETTDHSGAFGAQACPDLIVDFRRYFSIPASSLYKHFKVDNAPLRMSRLLSPYKEHFQVRAASYLSRVGLERDHTKPAPPAAALPAPSGPPTPTTP